MSDARKLRLHLLGWANWPCLKAVAGLRFMNNHLLSSGKYSIFLEGVIILGQSAKQVPVRQERSRSLLISTWYADKTTQLLV